MSRRAGDVGARGRADPGTVEARIFEINRVVAAVEQTRTESAS